MQQDDKNTFKITSPLMNQTHPANFSSKTTTPSPNPLHNRNFLQQGINYIVPAFWYQQLLEINSNLNRLSQIQIPSFQTYTSFLQLCDLQNPTQSTFRLKQQLFEDSASLRSEILQQSQFLASKTFIFSKINDCINQTQIEWTLINPYLWAFIESKYPLSHKNQSNQLNYTQKPLDQQNKYQQTKFFKSIPKIAVLFTKQFIHQKGKCKRRQIKQTTNPQDSLKFIYKSVQYTVPKKSINQEINTQLSKMSKTPIFMTLIIDQSTKRGKFFRKLNVQGFFCQNLAFKDLIKSLITIQSLGKVQSADKFYLYDCDGQKFTQKVSTVSNLISLSTQKRLIVCTTPLKDILALRSQHQEALCSLLKKQLNYPKLNNQQNIQNNRFQTSITKMKLFFSQLSNKNELKLIQDCLYDNSQKIQKYIAPIPTAGFKPYNRTPDESRIMSGTFYRSDDEAKQDKNSNQRQNESVRYLESVTTNLDTVFCECENQSQKIDVHSTYSNARLKKHSSSNRAQRKKRAQNYLSKKKNNYILRGNQTNNTKPQSHRAQSLDHKKRIKHPLLLSLANLQPGSQMLEYLVGNMRKVAIESICLDQNQLIRQPYSKDSQKDSQFFEPTNKKKVKLFKNSKVDIKKEKQREAQIERMQESLLRIAQKIERSYEPENDLEKGEDYQKCEGKNLIEKIYSDYEEMMAMKKDNEQIKTIIDNSEGPYSELEKHTIKVQFRQTQKVINKIQVQHDQFNSLSDGLNQIQDNDQTI